MKVVGKEVIIMTYINILTLWLPGSKERGLKQTGWKDCGKNVCAILIEKVKLR